MQPVLGLIQDPAHRSVYNLRRNLLAAMRRQTVEEDGVWGGAAHQLLVYLVTGELLPALPSLRLLTHASPHVGVNGPGVRCRCRRVFSQRRGRAEFRGQFNDCLVGGMAFGVGDGELYAGQGATYRERVGYVVAVADVR